MNSDTMDVLRSAAAQAQALRGAPKHETDFFDPDVLASEASRRCLIRQRLLDWASFAVGDMGLQPAAHHRLLLEELERLTRGDVDRLMVLMPPGSAKSTYVSIIYPAWWFVQHPHSSIIATSHTARLSAYFARRAQRLIIENANQLGYAIAPDSRAGSNWSTTNGGEYFAVGARGAVVGRRADLVLIDDPVRSQADADSLTIRDRTWDWFRSELTTRLKPGGRVILIMTRWHEDDLGGRLIEQASADWRVLKLPAIAEDGDPLGRPVGAPLWPEWENASALERKRVSLGERTWLALFQQTPRPKGGTLFRVDRFEFVDSPPPSHSRVMVRAWDLAATAETSGHDPDWTVGIKLMRDERGHFTVLDVIRLRGSPLQVEERIVAAARSDGPGVTISLPQDPGQAGKSQIRYFTAALAGCHVISSVESGSKSIRAGPAASQIEAGNVTLVRGDWNHAFIEELRDFPFGRKDDQVDAFSRALLELTNLGSSARQISAPLFER